MAQPRFYNTLTHAVEDFTPIDPPTVTMYNCGPTVYDFAHIGNFRSFLTADLIVAGIPFYNFGMPSGFKAYIDQIVRVGRTFSFNPDNKKAPFQPLTFGKRLIAVVSRGDGGYGPGGRNETRNHLDPHLRTAFDFIGVTDVTIVAVENDEHGGTALAESLTAARETLRRFVGSAKLTPCLA